MHINSILHAQHLWSLICGCGLILSSMLLGRPPLYAAAANLTQPAPSEPRPAITAASQTAMQFASLTAGDEHTCGLTTGNGVICWGANGDGQVGDGTTFAYRPAVSVATLQSGVQAVIANGGHSCALLSSGGVSCWGGNQAGQLGDGGTSERRVPVAVLGLTESITALAVGGSHSCALLQSGGVACWGRNQSGQLGNGANADQTTPVAVAGLGGLVTALTAGANHTCALLQSGAVQCWGDNANGQLGDQSTTARNLPTAVNGLAGPVKAIAAGSDHTCAILTDGQVQCWGDNARGQLGDGSREDRTSPVLVGNLRDIIATVAAGRFHTCALAIDGDLWCWGANNRGQLGTGTLESSRTPLRVAGVPGDATALTAGLDHTCALFKTKLPYCWGSNRARQLGQDAPGVASVPRLLQLATESNGVAPISGIPAIGGGRYHTCLITPSRSVQCWGRNSDGQLGDGTQLPRTQPVQIAGLSSNVMDLALGAEHSCALLQTGAVQCWGSNQSSQLGDGTTIEHLAPKEVIGLTGVAAAMVAGESHTCALVQPGGVKCWGSNTAGQLGDGTTTNAGFPVSVAGLSSGVSTVTAGATHTCALLQSGGAQCWGGNAAGQLGDGSQISRTTPVAVLGLSGVIALDAGGTHTCAVRNDGTVHCWGANNSGQLGNGSRIAQLQPVAVVGLPGAALSVAAGVAHTCALLQGGRVFCWGGNENSQLGDGTAEDRLTPVEVSGLAANVLSLNAGGYHTCVLVTGNRPLCWGRDSDGQLGAGALTQSATLVPLAEARPATLVINYATAQAGSTLTLIGSGLPYSSTQPLVINGTALTETIQVNPSGELIVYLATQAADNGAYQLQVGNPPIATTSVFLQALAPLRPAEGGGITYAIPAGISQPISELYLPVVGQ